MHENFSLDDYPDKTDEILVALHPENHPFQYGNMLSLKEIAERTTLSKDQVRYRIDMLVEEAFVIEIDTRDELDRPNDPVEYSLFDESHPELKRIMKTMDVLGNVSETPTRDDLMKLVDHIQNLESELEQLRDDLEADVDGMRDDIERIKDRMVY